MKPINEMTLTECLALLKRNFRNPNFHNDTIVKIADHIEQLNRWIPVSERMPNIDDTYHMKVLWMDEEGFIIQARYDEEPVTLKFVSWQRITPPEGV